MPRIAILLKDRHQDSEAGKAIQNNLSVVFAEKVETEVVFLTELENASLDSYDLILVLVFQYVQELYARLAQYPNREKLLYVSRTLNLDAVKKVSEIPNGEKVLVANQSDYTSFELLRLLYQLDIVHLNLVPWNPQMDISGFRYIITTSETKIEFPPDAQVVNVGYRQLDTYAFLDIISHLGIQDAVISNNLKRYADTLSDKHTDVEKWYLSSITNARILEKVMHKTDFGILVIRGNGIVDYCNDKAKTIFRDIIQTGLPLPSEQEFTKEWMTPSFKSGLVKVDREYVMVEKFPLSENAPEMGYYFACQTAQDINRSGSLLSRELRKSGMYARYSFEDIIYHSEEMRKCIDIAERLAKTHYAILLNGESGSGKELFAQSIHNASEYRNGPFVAINCAAFPDNLLESELFGYVSGAFTGSNRSGKTGLFELANKGTIFLDEIGEMPYALQAKLLRVLQEKRIMRVGDDHYIDIDARVISSTNRDLQKEISEGKFREDLYYRLSALAITIPPLRERKKDIVPLFQLFCDAKARPLLPSEEKLLEDYPWPGNVRELQNTAAYYNVIGQLNIAEKAAKRTSSANLEESIMEILRDHPQEGLGRGRMIVMLKEKGIIVSQVQLEEELRKMVQEGIITRGKGRRGLRMADSIGDSNPEE